MRTGEVAFRYPVMGVTPDRDLWGFPDLDRLTKCGTQTLRENMAVGMELIDAEGGRWRVASVRRLGSAGTLWQRILSRTLRPPPQSRIDHELEAMAPMSLAEVKAQVIVGLEAFPGYWCDDEADPEPELAPRRAAVMAAASIAELHEIMGLDTFEAY